MEQDQKRIANTQGGVTTIGLTKNVEAMTKQMEQNTKKQYVPFVGVNNNKDQSDLNAKNLVSQWEQKKNEQQKPIIQNKDSTANNQIQVGLNVKEIIKQKELKQKQQKELEEKQRQELDRLRKQNLQQEIKKDQKTVNAEETQIEKKFEVENLGIGLTVKERIQQKEQVKKEQKEQAEQKNSNSNTQQKKELDIKNQDQEKEAQKQIQKEDQLKVNVKVVDEGKNTTMTVPTPVQVLSVKDRIKLQEQQKNQQEQYKKEQETKINAQIGLSVKERIKLQEQQKQQEIQKKAQIQVQGINVKEIIKLQQQKQEQVVTKEEQDKKIGKLNDKVQQNVWVQKDQYEQDLSAQTKIIKTQSQAYDLGQNQEIEKKQKPLFQQLEKSELLVDGNELSTNEVNQNKNTGQDVQDQQNEPQTQIQEILNDNQSKQNNKIDYQDFLINEDQLGDLARDIQSINDQNQQTDQNLPQQEEQLTSSPFAQNQEPKNQDNQPSNKIIQEQSSEQQFPFNQEQQEIEQVANRPNNGIKDSDYIIKEDQLNNLAQDIEQMNKWNQEQSNSIQLEQSSFQIINMDYGGQITTGQTKSFDQKKANLDQLFSKGIDQQQFTKGKELKEQLDVYQQNENTQKLIDQRPQINQRQKRTQGRLEYD